MGGIICSLSVAAVLAAGGVLIHRKRQRESWYYTSRCAGCGYDLRNSASDRCPECGKPWWEK